jgi:hypothetical protein
MMHFLAPIATNAIKLQPWQIAVPICFSNHYGQFVNDNILCHLKIVNLWHGLPQPIALLAQGMVNNHAQILKECRGKHACHLTVSLVESQWTTIV